MSSGEHNGCGRDSEIAIPALVKINGACAGEQYSAVHMSPLRRAQQTYTASDAAADNTYVSQDLRDFVLQESDLMHNERAFVEQDEDLRARAERVRLRLFRHMQNLKDGECILVISHQDVFSAMVGITIPPGERMRVGLEDLAQD